MLITVTPVGGELILSKLLFLLYFILPLVFAPCTLLLGPSLAYSLLEAQDQGPRTGGYLAQSISMKHARLTPGAPNQVPRALDLGPLVLSLSGSKSALHRFM
jgi:hypothetical protein